MSDSEITLERSYSGSLQLGRPGSRISLRRASAPNPEPLAPPSPTLAHLTPEEIQILNGVFRRQERLEQEEELHVR